MAALPFTDTHVHFHDLRHPTLRYDWLEPGGRGPRARTTTARSRRCATGPTTSSRRRAFTTSTRVDPRPGRDRQPGPGRGDASGCRRSPTASACRTGSSPTPISPHPTSSRRSNGTREFANLRGIRDLRYDDYLDRRDWRRGYAHLERFGLVCCDDPIVEEMPLALELAREFPGITLCIDHAGFPRERTDEYFARGATRMRALAERRERRRQDLGARAWSTTAGRSTRCGPGCSPASRRSASSAASSAPTGRSIACSARTATSSTPTRADHRGLHARREQRALFSGNANRIFRLAD